MYSLSIHFGPNAVVWAFLFKEKDKAARIYESLGLTIDPHVSHYHVTDDFGQSATLVASQIHAVLLEDLDLTDEAKIVRSLANARNEVKARQRASTDPVIRSGMQQQGPSVLTPFRQN